MFNNWILTLSRHGTHIGAETERWLQYPLIVGEKVTPKAED